MVEGFESAIFDILLQGGDTVYASGYSDIGFLRVKPGMTTEQVKSLLGTPLDAYGNVTHHPGWEMGMRWTKTAHDSHYRVRVVLFQNNIVVEKHAEFYVD